MFDKAPLQTARGEGHKILGVRWVDVKKADATNRSRLVAKDVNTNNASGVFAATPPIDLLKYLLRRAARDRSRYMIHFDVARSYFYTFALRGVYLQRPPEDQTEKEQHLCRNF